MSSSYVRTGVKNFLAANLPGETVVDLSSAFEEIKELLDDAGVAQDAPWLGIEFFGDGEVPVGLAATNDQGLYRETGAVQFHFCTIARLGNGDELLTRAEALMDLLRGTRIASTIVVERLTGFNTAEGATLKFEGGYMSGSFLMGYHRDFNL